MMSKFVDKLMKETGKNKEELQPLWVDAKEYIAEEKGKDLEELDRSDFQEALNRVYNQLGLNEYTTDPSEFLKSNYSAKDFIETMVSGSLSGKINPDGGGIIRPEEGEEEDEDEDYGPTFTNTKRSVSKNRKTSSGDDMPTQDHDGSRFYDRKEGVELSSEEADRLESFDGDQFSNELDRLIDEYED